MTKPKSTVQPSTIASTNVLSASVFTPKGQTMNSISKNFASHLHLFTGQMNAIETEIPADDTTTQANWLVYVGDAPETKRTLHVILPDQGTKDLREKKNLVRNELNMWDHLANGDFDGWTLTEHLVQRTFKVASGLGRLDSSLNVGGTETVVLDPKTMTWKVVNGRVSNAPEGQQAYHDKINWFLQGDSIALYVPTVIGNGWIRSVVENLSKGPGNVIAAVEEAKLEAKTEREIYLVNKTLNEAGHSDVTGTEAQAPRLLVAMAGMPGKTDLYTVDAGTKFWLISNAAPDKSLWQAPMTWDPEDEAAVATFEQVSKSLTLSLRPA